MGTFLSVLSIGVSFGFILFLLAAGQSLVLGLMRILNVAHGALFMFGAYAGLAVAQYTHNFLIGLVVGSICTALIGILLYLGFLQRLFKQEGAQVLLTIGFVYILTNIAQWVWGPLPLSGVVPQVFSGYVPIGNITFPVFRLFVIGFGLAMAALLWWFQDKTKTGAIVRAGMDNREVVGTLGINLKVVFTGLFVVGSLLAGLCGFMAAPLMGINLGISWEAFRLSLIVVIVGGTGSIQGALLGGVMIGLLNAFGMGYFPDFAYFIVYIALILILIFKPAGLMGRIIQTQRTVDQATLIQKYASREADGELIGSKWPTRMHSITPYAALGLILLIVPQFIPTFGLTILTTVLVFAIFAMSLDLMLGYTGMVSLGHAAFMGVAGYTMGILAVHFHIQSFWLLAVAGIIVSAIVAAVIGFIALRVTGPYFLLVTLAFGELMAMVATKWSGVTGGTDGLVNIPLPVLGIPGFSWTSMNLYYLVFIVFVICYLILYRIVNSAFGQALIGVRENEMRMKALGYNAWALKYVTFIISGTIAGFSGILYIPLYGSMVPANLQITSSAVALLAAAMGGEGTLFGPFIGAALIVVVQQVSGIYTPDRWPLILGIIFVICVVGVRGGFAKYFSAFWRNIKFQRSGVSKVTDSAKD